MTTPIGDVLNGLGITTDLDDEVLVGGAIVILKLVDANTGTTWLREHWSEGLAIYERVGMLDVAHGMDLQDALSGREDDD